MTEEFICHKCIPDDYLKKEIKTKGKKDTCIICQAEHRRCIELSTLTERVISILDKTIILGDEKPQFSEEGSFSHFEQAGSALETYLAEIFDCNEDDEIVHAILSELSNISSYELINGGTPAYDTDARYQPKPIVPIGAEIRWHHFKQSIYHERRFFNEGAESFLAWIFEDLENLGSAENLITRTIEGPDIYRARQCDNMRACYEILRAPEKNLGPPPKDKAKNGRMNPRGIPAFYGAFDRETCIAELRPPVGSIVISGAFALTRPIRVLDFTAMEKAYNKNLGSPFSKEYSHKLEKLYFIRTLHNKISLPVHPDQDHEYLSTQFIAEYLAYKIKPAIDGLIYASPQIKNHSNIVIFPQAALAETSFLYHDKPPAIKYAERSLRVHNINAASYKYDTLDEDDLSHSDYYGDPYLD